MLLSALLGMTSCEDFLASQMKLDQTEFTLPAKGGEIKVSFVPISSWTASCSDSFVTLNPTKGDQSEASVSLSIKVGENTDTAVRTIKVLLSFETNDIVLTIKQDGATPPDDPNPDDPDPDDPDPDDPDPDDPDPDDPNPDDPNPDDPNPDDPDPDDPNPDDPNPDDPNPDDPDPDDPDPDDPNPDDPDPDDPDPDDPDGSDEGTGSTEDVIPGDEIKAN